MTSFRPFSCLAAAILLGALVSVAPRLDAQTPQVSDVQSPSVLPPDIDGSPAAAPAAPQKTAQNDAGAKPVVLN